VFSAARFGSLGAKEYAPEWSPQPFANAQFRRMRRCKGWRVFDEIAALPIARGESALAHPPILAGHNHRVAPLCRGHAHASLEDALEGGLRLVSDRRCYCCGGYGRLLSFVSCLGHPDVRQEINGGPSQSLLEMARDRCPRHMAQARQLRPGPLVGQARETRRPMRAPDEDDQRVQEVRPVPRPIRWRGAISARTLPSTVHSA
jgi:hypothetical protein